MSKRLVLVRHAKSSWDDTTLRDRERPLSSRGRRTAPAVAAALHEAGWDPDAVICSNAVRALQTWTRMKPELPDCSLTVLPSLYMGDEDDIRDALRSLDDEVQTVWVVGHNPGWEMAAQALCGFEGAIKTADTVWMSSEQPTWTRAASGRWAFEEHLAARTVDPKGLNRS